MLPKSLLPLLPYFKKYRRSYVVGALCVFLTNGIWILFAQVIRLAVDDLKQATTNHTTLHHHLSTYALLLLAVAVTKGIFQYLTRWIVIGVSREIEFDLRNDLFQHLERLSYSYYQRTRTGDIMARVTNDLNAVRMLLGPAIMYSANTIVFTAGALAFMLHISPKLTFYAFLPLPVVSIAVQYFGAQIHERFERIQAMFSDISARVQENFSGARLIRAYVQEEPEIADEETAGKHAHAIHLEGEIEFCGLNFAYNGKQVLHDINLRIPAGSSLALVGPTGSGKTTLVSLIPRIYDAAPGSVLIDGSPIREFPLEFLRRQIGFVPQETFLFSETVRENIAFGAEGASDDEVRAAAEAASIAAEIEGFPEQYQTMVGERGITLSGGQKQRTAIARAIIRNPRILILDDALSSVDTHTEDKILNHLREVMRGRTTIFISHRVSTVRNADMIAVLHSGRIVELGTHDELIARNGYYTDLYNKQLLEEELAEV